MDHPTVFVALVLGIVEGLTEFLPISSTGHLIVAGSLLGYTGEQREDVRDRHPGRRDPRRLLGISREALASRRADCRATRDAQRFVVNLLLAFLPAADARAAVPQDHQARTCSRRCPSRCAFIVGAFVILWVERRQRVAPSTVRIDSVDAMRWTDALKIGFAQALALIPGTSRSGATIIGGMLFGLSRPAATEFSFFLAIPTLLAACAYEFDAQPQPAVDAAILPAFGVGFVAAFISAFLCVRWLIRYVSRHDFVPFAWYRIAFGLLILAHRVERHRPVGLTRRRGSDRCSRCSACSASRSRRS